MFITSTLIDASFNSKMHRIILMIRWLLLIGTATDSNKQENLKKIILLFKRKKIHYHKFSNQFPLSFSLFLILASAKTSRLFSVKIRVRNILFYRDTSRYFLFFLNFSIYFCLPLDVVTCLLVLTPAETWSILLPIHPSAKR